MFKKTSLLINLFKKTSLLINLFKKTSLLINLFKKTSLLIRLCASQWELKSSALTKEPRNEKNYITFISHNMKKKKKKSRYLCTHNCMITIFFFMLLILFFLIDCSGFHHPSSNRSVNDVKLYFYFSLHLDIHRHPIVTQPFPRL